MFSPTHIVYTTKAARYQWDKTYELDENFPNLYREVGDTSVGSVSEHTDLIEMYSNQAERGIVLERIAPLILENE